MGGFLRMAALSAAACILAASNPVDAQERPRRDTKALMELLKANNLEPWNAGSFLIETGTCIAIEAGTCGATKQYYDRVKGLMKFDIANSNLASFVDYLGYGGIAPADLEILTSFELMPRDAAEFDALAAKVAQPDQFRKNLKLEHFQKSLLVASRFFAPKIVNYNVPPNTEKNQNPHNAGWRKLVRFAPIPDSPADKAGVKHAYVLFNYVQKDAAKPPFPASAAELTNNESFNTQIIVVPKSFLKKKEDSAYFFLYQPNSKNYAVGDALNAAFDIIEEGPVTKNYYVPQSCAQCHGHDREKGLDAALKETGVRPFAKVNYLDTDQWYDMLNAEFPATRNQKKFDVVFDGGVDHQSKDYARAMDVFRLLNAEIAEQVKGALRYGDTNPGPPPSDQYKLAAVEKWNEIHKTNNAPVGIFGRVLGAAGTTWDANNELDRNLLPMLNQYCFRCHSSIFYDVFDKRGVKVFGPADMQYQVGMEKMPQGRKLDIAIRDQLYDYLGKLDAQP